LRLHLVKSDILRNESDQNTNDFCLLEVLGIGNGDDIKQHQECGIRDADSQSKSPMLTPLNTWGQEWSSPAPKIDRSRSPSNCGIRDESDQSKQQSQQLCELEEEACKAADHLRLAQDELAMESSKENSCSIDESPSSVAMAMTNVFQKKLNYNIIKIAKTMRILLEIEHIKNQGVTLWCSIAWEILIQFLSTKIWPPSFYVFYLQWYSHSFSNFNDIIIQFFLKNIGHDCGKHYFPVNLGQGANALKSQTKIFVKQCSTCTLLPEGQEKHETSSMAA